ncbi:hypothetical protein A2853_01935 [Candidatus Kaiserbacteria bacterium RIFCSPHIGHO2_01_FULL_55_17]|uniref:Uncharacterized protein n=1 Tax=Candidatus Kaiserbacteria bacterium RIFCSPHIGHO2_01_FULL_55_17 TaxID=1798484 RepID=A0A1F6D848_9BACT|nr:MAG: hypothetical protein A2853_01935 [Candidatus Kaiserbacteria bacterium RIFCSPHIGHO2_01_FULL_55_17]
MIERMRENPDEVLKKGDLVKLRDDIDPEGLELILSDVLQPGIAYRVLHLERHHDEGGTAVWLGPNDMTPQDVEDFSPELAVEFTEERYKDVFPLAARYLRKALN